MLSKGRTSSPRDILRTNDELSRILDPSYTSSSHVRSSTYAPYVDAQGTLHDPDYRHFPLLHQHSSSPRRRSTAKSSHRPHWELVDEEAGLLTDDDDMLLQEDTETGYYAKRNSWGARPTTTTTSSPRHYSPSRRSSYPPRSSAFSGAILLSSPADVSPPTSWSSSGSAYSQSSSSPASTSSSVLQQQQAPSRSSPFEAGSSSEKSRCRIGSSLSRKRRGSAATALSADKDARKAAKRTSFDYDDEDYTWYRRGEEGPVAEVAEVEEEEEEVAVPRDYQTDEDEDDDDGEPRRVEEDADCVPSCTDALKRRWQALSLSIRFGMFRAEKRIKRRVQSLI